MNTRTAPLATRTWSVEIRIDEHEGETHAQALLHTGDATSLSASGSARLSPRDRDVPEIGDELAAARALSRLAHDLLDAAAGDIENLTHEHVDLDH